VSAPPPTPRGRPHARLKSERVQYPVPEAQGELPGWEVSPERSQMHLVREFSTRDEAQAFLEMVIVLADEQGASPRLVYEDRRVEVGFPTTETGGVTVGDLEVARSVSHALASFREGFR